MSNTNYNNPYFNSEASEVIFYLLQLDGELRASKLKISCVMYSSKLTSSKWYNNLLSILTESDHQFKDSAIAKLNSIYKKMAH